VTVERSPAVAGKFYPAGADVCGRMADDLVGGVKTPAAVGAVVPHAGWVYSGAAAALSWAGIAAAKPATVVIFGAMNGLDRNAGSLFASGSWQTPLGAVAVDDELARLFLRCRYVREAPDAHASEHSIEVQLPLLKRLLPDVRIVPLSVQPGSLATEIGRACAAECLDRGRSVAFVASTDLTHYGPAFGFEPMGRGRAGIRWAKEVNDRRMVKLIMEMNADAIVPEAAANRNACGSGAVAAIVSAMRELGGVKYQELLHTCSAEVRGFEDPNEVNSVGYEAGVFTAWK
jgi:MEMO1 family protein